ncbi:MAG: ABC transporter permease, partial [Microbacterium sp.]
LSLIGGFAGLALGATAAVAIAAVAAQPVVIPIDVLAAGIVLSVLVGVLAGLQPAAKAARLSPTAALRSV